MRLGHIISLIWFTLYGTFFFVLNFKLGIAFCYLTYYVNQISLSISCFFRDICSLSLRYYVFGYSQVKELTEQFPAVTPLSLVLKQFLADRSLDQSYSGGLSSYCLVSYAMLQLATLITET